MDLTHAPSSMASGVAVFCSLPAVRRTFGILSFGWLLFAVLLRVLAVLRSKSASARHCMPSCILPVCKTSPSLIDAPCDTVGLSPGRVYLEVPRPGPIWMFGRPWHFLPTSAFQQADAICARPFVCELDFMASPGRDQPTELRRSSVILVLCHTASELH